MPALVPTSHQGTIRWLGRVPHREEMEIETEVLDEMRLGFDGPEGDVHGGLTRPSCSRVLAQYPRGTVIRNTRQLSILSEEEMGEIAHEMGVSHLDPRWLGASIVLSGLPDLSHLPPGARLQAVNGTTLTVDLQNRPCHLPAMTMEPAMGRAAKGFKAAARTRRGVTAWVERPGTLRLDDALRLHVPDQRGWRAGG